MTRNNQLLRLLRAAPKARFLLCDLHVHSPASSDIRTGERFARLSQVERELLETVRESLAGSPVEFEREVLNDFPVDRFHALLVEQRDRVAGKEGIPKGEDWAFVAITDHNVCEYAASLSKHAWQQRNKARLVVLPGLELDVCFAIAESSSVVAHVLLVFSPETEASDIRVAICEVAGGNWAFGETLEVPSLPLFVQGIRCHQHYPALAIAAHVSSAKGVRGAIRQRREQPTFTALEAAIARTSAEIEQNPDADREALELRLRELRGELEREADRISVDVLKLLGSCGFDGLQVSCKQDAIHYRRLHRFREHFGRAVPLVASDAHCSADVFLSDGNVPYLKLALPENAAEPKQVLSAIRHALLYGETRFSYSTPGQVRTWIAGVEITPESEEASPFWPFKTHKESRRPFVLPLSRNLNCLIGGRGSGKSAAIEALAFLSKPACFDECGRKRDQDLPDWYKRAKATLAGCHVRLVWRSVGGALAAPKGTIFASRYFTPSGQHGAIAYHDIDGKEVPAGPLNLEPAQIFRARDIENYAEPDLLRQLFDELVGGSIPALEERIADLRGALADHRVKMVEIADRVLELTEEETAPLREYARRKAAYEAANRPEVKPLFKDLDEASSAEAVALAAEKRWDEAVSNPEADEREALLLEVFDWLDKRVRDKHGKSKPYCDSLSKLFEADDDGNSPRERLVLAFKRVEEEVRAIGRLLEEATRDTGAHRRAVAEALEKQGMPQGAKDREAKKRDLQQAETALSLYRELLAGWEQKLEFRKQLFKGLEKSCRERTELRAKTARRLCDQLARDLDPATLLVRVEVHPMQDRSALRRWLEDHVGPCIPRSREARVSALMEKGFMPAQIRDSLLGASADDPSLFAVDKGAAKEGRIEPDLVENILHRCTGKLRLEPEHASMTVTPSEEFIAQLPAEVKDGLWTFPRSGDQSDTLLIDAVLQLDEVIFDDRPEILLNDRPNEQGSTLRPIGELSNGQRCSAILPILLLNGHGPLVIDQPEDNLDNRLIRQVIINILASIKLRRQVIVATHNPNIPVLGDVEQAIVLRAIEERQCRVESTGDLDSRDTVAHLTEIMEGGREAFQYRQSIYQSHWAGPVEETASG